MSDVKSFGGKSGRTGDSGEFKEEAFYGRLLISAFIRFIFKLSEVISARAVEGPQSDRLFEVVKPLT